MTLCGHSNHFIIHVQKYQKEKGKLSKIHRLVSLVVINFWYGRKLASHIYFSKLVKRLIFTCKIFYVILNLTDLMKFFLIFFQLFTFLTFLSHHGKIPKYQDLGKKLRRQQPNVSALLHPSQEREVSVSVCAPAGCSNSKRGSFPKTMFSKTQNVPRKSKQFVQSTIHRWVQFLTQCKQLHLHGNLLSPTPTWAQSKSTRYPLKGCTFCLLR